MKISCYRCGGKGRLEEFSHIMGGVCFTCGGDGIVNTFSTIKLNKMTFKSQMRDYLSHSSNRDLASLYTSGEIHKLDFTQNSEVKYELIDRAEKYYGIDTSSYTIDGVAKQVIAKLDEMEKNMPKPYEKNPYFKEGKVSLVPVHWLKKFQGNPLRRYDDQMQEFSQELVRDGLKEPVMISIGQEDRKVSVGEGNHRMNAFILAGLDYVPARVVRSKTNWGVYSQFYDKMSRVPVDGYFKGDASPEEVFDTMYDQGDLSTLDSKAMKKMGYEEINIPSLEIVGDTTKGIFAERNKKVSKALTEELSKLLEDYKNSQAGESLSLKTTLDDAIEWYSEKDGILIMDIEKAILNITNNISLFDMTFDDDDLDLLLDDDL